MNNTYVISIVDGEHLLEWFDTQEEAEAFADSVVAEGGISHVVAPVYSPATYLPIRRFQEIHESIHGRSQ